MASCPWAPAGAGNWSRRRRLRTAAAAVAGYSRGHGNPMRLSALQRPNTPPGINLAVPTAGTRCRWRSGGQPHQAQRSWVLLSMSGRKRRNCLDGRRVFKQRGWRAADGSTPQ